MLLTALAFIEYIVALSFLVMLILYIPLTIFRVIVGDTVIRRRGLIALGVTLLSVLILWLIPNAGWGWWWQFGLLTLMAFIPLNFHAALRNLPGCQLPNLDRHLLIATVIVLTVGMMIPGLGMKGAMAILATAALGG